MKTQKNYLIIFKIKGLIHKNQIKKKIEINIILKSYI